MAIVNEMAPLVTAAEAAIERAYLAPAGLFCYGVRADTEQARRPSLRYSAIVGLGLVRRAQSAAALSAAARRVNWRDIELRQRVSCVVEALRRRAAGRIRPSTTDPAAFSIGDLGLLLWLDAASDRRHLEETLRRLESATAGFANRRLVRSTAMELAWMLLGCLETAAHVPYALVGAEAACVYLVQSLRDARTHLFRHRASGLRGSVANFADQVYPVMALARYARVRGDGTMLRAAAETAGALVRLQGPQGQWPWLFRARHGAVAEPYPVFAVHQYGMAPMALAEVAEAGGSDFSDAVRRGLRWVMGENELAAVMADAAQGTFCRAIERAPWAARLAAARAVLGGRGGWSDAGNGGRAPLVINRAARSYELGWLLYAWSSPPSGQRSGCAVGLRTHRAGNGPGTAEVAVGAAGAETRRAKTPQAAL